MNWQNVTCATYQCGYYVRVDVDEHGKPLCAKCRVAEKKLSENNDMVANQIIGFVKKQEAQIKDARKQLRFYSDKNNWFSRFRESLVYPRECIVDDDFTNDGPPNSKIGGNRAREFFERYPDE